MLKCFMVVLVMVTFLPLVWSGEVEGKCQEVRTLDISATGSVMVKPNLANIYFNIEAHDVSASRAYSDHKIMMNKVLSAIKDDVESKDLQTQGMSLQPRYRYSKREEKQVFENYLVQQQLLVSVRDVDHVSKVLDSAVGAGGLLQNVNFMVEDQDAAEKEASQKAYAAIQEKAAKIADSLGIKIGKPLKIQDHKVLPHGPRNPMMRGARMEAFAMADEGSGSVVESGEIKVTHTVDITYEIE